MFPVDADNRVGDGNIFNAVQKENIAVCAQLTDRDPTVLKQRGWGGFTPLHYAALQGSRPLADLLLSHGADCNVRCDAGQTPFHFACRQGNVYIMNEMLEHGADLRLADLQGKTALHYSVLGGNVVAVQYLWEKEVFRFSDTDNSRITPLHLAASTGNVDMVRYLLRNNRCAVEAVDQQGVTALHMAAANGAVEASWLLLRTAGLRALHMQSHGGLTPVDLCRRGDSFRHQELAKMFMKFINKAIDSKLSESNGVYWWMLLLPTVSGAAVFLSAVALGAYGGLLCLLVFPWLASCIFSQYHRMSSYQRLPNPIYLGTMVAGIVHSLVCFFGNIVPNIWPCDSLLHVSVIHFSVVLWMFWKLLTKDPGEASKDLRLSSVTELVAANENLSRFCIYCEMFQPDMCKHCKLCDACILEYDHHCLFLNRCVARDNRRLFILFLLAMVVGHGLFLLAATWCLWRHLGDSWWALTGADCWVLALAVMNLLTGLWEVWLLREQIQALSMGTTTYFKHPLYPERPQGQDWVAAISYLFTGRLNHPLGCASSENV